MGNNLRLSTVVRKLLNFSRKSSESVRSKSNKIKVFPYILAARLMWHWKTLTNEKKTVCWVEKVMYFGKSQPTFSDRYPYMMISQTSLDDLNQRLVAKVSHHRAKVYWSRVRIEQKFQMLIWEQTSSLTRLGPGKRTGGRRYGWPLRWLFDIMESVQIWRFALFCKDDFHLYWTVCPVDCLWKILCNFV